MIPTQFIIDLAIALATQLGKLIAQITAASDLTAKEKLDHVRKLHDLLSADLKDVQAVKVLDVPEAP